MSTNTKPLDVWLRSSDDEDHSDFEALPDGRFPAEANTYQVDSGFVVEWYLTAVGLVTSVPFDTYDAARQWLEAGGFQDFSTGDEDPVLIQYECGHDSWTTPHTQCWGCVANECHDAPCCNCECHPTKKEN